MNGFKVFINSTTNRSQTTIVTSPMALIETPKTIGRIELEKFSVAKIHAMTVESWKWPNLYFRRCVDVGENTNMQILDLQTLTIRRFRFRSHRRRLSSIWQFKKSNDLLMRISWFSFDRSRNVKLEVRIGIYWGRSAIFGWDSNSNFKLVETVASIRE